MRPYVARVIVVMCGYGLLCYRALYAKYERLFWRDAGRLRWMRAIQSRGVVGGHKKSPKRLSKGLVWMRGVIT
jgi:hypothetical protein